MSMDSNATKAAAAALNASAISTLHAATSLENAAASIIAASSAISSADPLGRSQNMVLAPNRVYSLQLPVKLEHSPFVSAGPLMGSKNILQLEKDSSPKPNPVGDAMLNFLSNLEAAATTAESAANKSEEATFLREAAASIRAASTPVVSAGPLMGSQNIVKEEPHAVSSLEPPVELESVRESFHTMGISEEAPKSKGTKSGP
ncbi:hypothetical protein DAPPUDRAFT_108058 [Daphnia pulex]|uniref:Uncharacterized protein n=1 Tax=Daphnia pulex TaxID=6669 RepID=E9GZ15_DAPPU|nr:hypothetical protein DAPPUDRAFT_108058 [Daphnia pulex]|eukprot:EFX75251.1 hypothetical protein DAPPUDRAFT_108058 [Daphnia pulex]